MSTTAPKRPTESRLLAALDALSLSDVVEAPQLQARTTHPFFAPAIVPVPRLKSAAAPKKSTLQRISQPKAEAAEAAEPAAVAADLPFYSYKTRTPAPTMHFTRDDADADNWVAKLDLTGGLSVDFEWVVVYRKGATRPISLVQIADARTILVIQLRSSSSSMTRFPLGLQRVLEDARVPKAGANILADAKKVFRDYGVMMAGLVELGALARRADPGVWGAGRGIVALAKLVERYLQKRLRKDADVRVSNWEDRKLETNARQIEYAANDAYCGLEVYTRLLALAEANDITLDVTSTATGVHHASLAAPATSHAPKDAVPMIVLTPDMAAAGVAPQHLRAYRHWALGHRDMDTMCTELALRPEALARGTIVTYVVSAIQRWPSLAYDLGTLRLLIQMDLKSWERHYEWVARVGDIAC
ncbi:ribonuclease H-like domain-containing protein [Mycena haematopus]|nr:ribonuclease H-like domain-containing protein [Mycena haematopus]